MNVVDVLSAKGIGTIARNDSGHMGAMPVEVVRHVLRIAGNKTFAIHDARERTTETVVIRAIPCQILIDMDAAVDYRHADARSGARLRRIRLSQRFGHIIVARRDAGRHVAAVLCTV